jgi:mannose-6-phosphate isomerase
VRALAHGHDDPPDRLLRHPGFQPKQKRNYESRRLLSRHHVRRTDESHDKPSQHRQPVFKKRFHPEISTETPNIQHRTPNVQWQKGIRDRSYELRIGRWRMDIGRLPTMSRNEVTSPLTFEPIFIERMWGGRRLESEFHKKLPPRKRIGESWEIVDRSEAQSVVISGPLRGKTLHELWMQRRQEIFGDVPDTPRFPLLIKLLDAQEKLSLQVHPPEHVASRLGGEAKSECWYVAAADPNAELFLGFREQITRDKFDESVREGSVIDYVHRIAVQAGDAVFLPAGRVHAIGAGNLLIEIQQNSDTTYRVFDWDRTDPATAMKRDLHVEQAIQCIDFDDVQPHLIQAQNDLLIRDRSFEIRKWKLDEVREAAPLGQFAIVCCLTGNLSCAKTSLKPGEIFLLPAYLEDRQLNPLATDTSLLRVTLPKL